ncbi:VOC family protein [Novosphingobium sp. Leaf2]|uniref:VOC family protein n=1 Tax=Novosphingobium sp. Leaf2 TaxID=1735670 RepID=UPI0006FD13D3|nr:VOC family protein [Novosphingobium sp. Leaf2]KQM20802.1 bleomycin resistance protein [Novosphingobium sp. Leaf2]
MAVKFVADRWGRPKDSLVAALYYLELGCTEPAATAAFYGRAMGYGITQQDASWIAEAPGRCLILSRGAPKTLLSAGFAVPDVGEIELLQSRLDAADRPYTRGATYLFQEAITLQDPDGHTFTFGIPAQARAEPIERVPPARLQHVVVASRNPARIVKFFIDVLGFTLSDDVLDDEGGVRTSFLRCSHEHHSFAVFLAPEDRLDHHCYETSDWNAIRDWADHMASEHIRLQWGPGRHGPGNNLFIFVHDPDGNWVEISAELEVVGHDRPVGKWIHEQRTLNSWGQGLLRS